MTKYGLKKGKFLWVKTLLFLLLVFFAFPVFGQTVVNGTVTDASGAPMPGVSVTVKGTTRGTITDMNGGYNAKVNPKSVLVFTSIGMESQQVKVAGRSVINVSLKEDVSALGEVVVVGYGKQRKASLTGAVSAINGDELLKTPSTNVSSLLGGRLPGISSVQVSGEPGDDQASLRVRGSLNAATYIVDGIPRSINDIDPNDVESISVLKDGASAAVYGLQGSGGVIIITTKKGKEGKSQITYNGSYGVSTNANFPKFLNGPQFAYYYNMGDMMDKLANGTISSASEYTPIFSQDNVKAMTNGDPTDGWDNVDYIKKVFGTGTNQKHSITAQGGTEKLRYYTSLGFMDQNGNIDKFTYKRYNLRANIDAEVAKNLHLNLGLAGNVGKRHTPGYSSGGTDAGDSEEGWLSVAHQAIMMHPYLPEKYNGLYTATIQKNTSLANSPLAAIYESGYKKTNSLDIQSNISLQYDVPFLKGLSLKINGSYDYESSHNKNLNTPYYVYAFTTPTSTATWTATKTADPRGTTDGINMGEGESSYTNLVGQGSATYVHSFGKHNIDVLALIELHDNSSYSFSAYGKNLSFADLPELSLSTATSSPISGSSDKSRSAGFVYRLKYDYADKYLAEFTGRYDGSYKFIGNVSGKRWGFFPSASAAWRISKEGFMENWKFLDDLKIRASIGLLGNDAGVPEYSYLSTYGFDGQIVQNGTLANAVYTKVVANPGLTWEKTLSYNTGFDFTMWGGKLSMDVDGFYNYTYDMLILQGGGYPPSMGGYFYTYANYDKMDVKGLELTIGHRNKFMLAGKRFDYGVNGNMTYAKSRYLKYTDGANDVNWRKRVGKSVDANLGWVAEGLFKSEDEITNSAWYNTRPNVGDIKYKDLDGNGVIDENDKTMIGKSNRPELTFGLNLNGSWNGFDFNAQFTGGLLFDVSLTGTYYNGSDDNTVWTQTFKENANSPLYLAKNAYSAANTNGDFPRITIGNLTHGGDNGLASTFWLRNGNYVRLKSAQIGYSLPRRLLSKIDIQGLRLYVEGSNIFTIDGLPQGIDPESPRVNNGYYPQQRTFMGGVTLTF